MATLKDIAEKVGVSVMTVSKVLNSVDSPIKVGQETKDEILRVARELNYRPNVFARYLKIKRSDIIGVIVPDIADPYFGEMVSGTEQVLNEHGYFFLLSTISNSLEKEKSYLEKLRLSQAHGIMITGSMPQVADREIAQLVEDGIPVVLIGREFDNPQVPYVTVDNELGGFLAVEYLIKLGHRRIGFIIGPDYSGDAQQRLVGYKKALAEYGLQYDEDLVIKGGNNEESGYQSMEALLDRKRSFSAVCTFNDRTALGAMRAIRDHGMRVPEDISIVGFDDIPTARCSEPPLTTIRQPVRELGRQGALLLIKRLKRGKGSEEPCDRVILPLELMVRESCTQPVLCNAHRSYIAGCSRVKALSG